MTEQEKWEKVINNLEYQIHLLYDIIPHVSRDDGEYLEAAAKTMSDALALLKAQEPVEPLHLHDQSKLPIKCGNCGAFIIIINKPFGIGDYKANYCCECGRAVKW